MKTSALISLVMVTTISTVIYAQQVAGVEAATGAVTGHVVCADTQRPARFAVVMLFGVPKAVTEAPNLDADPAKAISTFKSSVGEMNLSQTQTDVSGYFSLSGVQPGDYYVFGSVPGYVEPKNMVQAAMDAGVDVSKPIPGIPIVHVVAGRTSQTDVNVERGAAISGRVVWDDGSPVTHAVVSIIPAKGKQKDLLEEYQMLVMGTAMSGGFGGLVAITDDLGQFRVSSQAPGDYLVKASLQTHSMIAMNGGVIKTDSMVPEAPLVVYAPASFHQAAGEPVTLHAGEEHSGEVVTVNLNGLHSVSGRVTSAGDHHGINSARVKLEDASDENFSRSGGVDVNGNFTITFVPSGTYKMTVSDAGDAEPAKKTSIQVFSRLRANTPCAATKTASWESSCWTAI